MIRTAGNIIALSSLISGVHCHFLNHLGEQEVVIKAGDHMLSEGIQMTSNVCPYNLSVSLEGDELIVSTWESGVLMNQIRIKGEDSKERAELKATVVNILKGVTKFE